MPASNYYGPKFYEAEIIARIGLSPFGDPLYRVALIGKIITKKTLEWTDWADGTDVALRGGITTDPDTGKPVVSPYKPLRRVTERREVEKYWQYVDDGKAEHFLLERWWPMHVLAPGGKQDWFAPEHIVPGSGGDSIFGEYPQYGDYEEVVGTFPKPPSLSYVLEYIAARERHLQQMERDVAKRAKERAYEGYRLAQRESKARRTENAYRIRDAISVANSSTLAAGRWRTEMAERMGYLSHIGN
jgi:hypothetical protein